MTIRVVTAPYRGLDGYFIGRPSVLASPFNIGLHGKRMAVIEKYRTWLWNQIKKEDPIVMDELNRLLELWRGEGRLSLVCFCAPSPCHGDVIASALKWLEERSHLAKAQESP